MMEEERVISSGQGPYGRTGQLQRQLWALSSKGEELREAFAQKKRDVEQFQLDVNMKVKEVAQDAYATIEAVVELLLSVSNARKRLSRENTSIIVKLEEAVAKFETLTSTIAEIKDTIGRLAGDYMSLGNEAMDFADALINVITTVNGQIQPTWDINFQQDFTESESISHIDEYDEKLREAYWGRHDSVGNRMASLFSSDVRDNLQGAVGAAVRRRDDNSEKLRRVECKWAIFYRYWVLTRNISAALLLQRKLVINVATAYDDGFRSITTVQDTKVALQRGIRDLKNKILSPDFQSTRDNALKIIVDLLEADNHVFMGETFYEDTEQRVKRSIHSKLGQVAVEKLSEPLLAYHTIENFELS